MPDNEKFPTLFEDANYLIFRSDDKSTVTLVDHGRGISSMFPYEEWCEFSRTIVAAANKDCELNEADDQARVLGGIEVSVIDRMIEKATKPLMERVDELERGLHEPIIAQEETDTPDDNTIKYAPEILDMLERCAMAMSQKGTVVKEEFLNDVRNVIREARGEKECENIDEEDSES